MVVIRLAGRAVDHLVEHAHADQVVGEVDIETCKTLRRLIGEQERRQEGAEFAGHRAGIDNAVTGVDRCQRDGEAAEHFHQRTGAVGDARHLVGFVLDRTDADGETAPHLVFEREGLDHAHALQRLLHGFDDLRARGELHAGDTTHPANELAQEQERRRRDDESAERHRRILNNHDDAQPDQRHQIATYGGDQKVDHLADGDGAGREPAMNSDE